MKLRSAYLTFHRKTNAEFARVGLTADQFVLLTALVKNDGATQVELVRCIASDPNTMSGMLVRLERQGFVIRQRNDADGRSWCVSLTPEGLALQKRAWAGTTASRELLGGLFSVQEAKALATALEQIAQTMTSEGISDETAMEGKNDADR